MNKVFLLILSAVCIANYSFSQNKAMNPVKEPAAGIKKEAGLLKAADSLPNVSGTYVLDMKKSTFLAGDTTGNGQALKNSVPAKKELAPDNAKIIATPVKPLLKDEK